MSVDVKFSGLTIAVTNMSAMLAFYKAVFAIHFEASIQYGAVLYRGKWGDWEVLFCPAEIAGNTAQQNRQQFDFTTTQFDQLLVMALGNGGSQMGEVVMGEGMRSVGVKDPDGNSMVFKEFLHWEKRNNEIN